LADELVNIGFIIIGGFIGSSLLTLFPYFMDKKKTEELQAEIRKKAPEARTPEENYILESKPAGFFSEFKYRFFFGLLAGIGSVLAFLQAGLGEVGNLTTGAAVFSGITASGFFSALADKIRST
jgi:hypothetical protein